MTKITTKLDTKFFSCLLYISIKNALKQQFKPIIVLFYCLTIFATGLAVVLMIYQTLYPGSFTCTRISENLTYYRLLVTIIYVCLIWIFFLIGLSMIQLGYSFGIIFHQGRAKAAKRRLIVFVIGFSVFITTGLIVTIAIRNKANYKTGLVRMIARFCLSLGIAILNTCVLCWLHKKLRTFNNHSL